MQFENVVIIYFFLNHTTNSSLRSLRKQLKLTPRFVSSSVTTGHNIPASVPTPLDNPINIEA
jgi:hypothetical protein